MTTMTRTVFLLDVDNTLFDNDRLIADLSERLVEDFGASGRDEFWRIYEELRAASGLADYLGTLQRFRGYAGNHRAILDLSRWILDYPFARNLYPETLSVIAHLDRFGPCVIFSDGDIVFQPHKVERSGLGRAVGGRVLIEVHKELALPSMELEYPARHYVAVDDKPRLLAAIKRFLGRRVTTIFVRQGHYALAADSLAVDPQPDLVLEHLSAILDLDVQRYCSTPTS